MVACKKPAGGDGSMSFMSSKRDVSKFNEIVTTCDGGGPIYLTRTGSPYRELYKEPYKFRFPTFKQWLGISGFLAVKGVLVMMVGVTFHTILVENDHIPHIDPLICRICWAIGWGEVLACLGIVGIMGLSYLWKMALGREV